MPVMQSEISRNNVAENYKQFEEDFNSQMQDYIVSTYVDPIVVLLPELRKALKTTE